MKLHHVTGLGGPDLLEPRDAAAKKWLKQNCCHEEWQWLGGSLAVEPRYTEDILAGFQEHGGRLV